MNIYLAGPFFNPEQIALLEKLEIILSKKGLNVFSPRKYMSKFPFGSYEWQFQNFVTDVNAIQHSDITFAIYNDQDSGTMWEVGYTWSLKNLLLFLIPKKKLLIL
ncbi:nucleoside 2-deoxyribosyltransferase [Bacillus cereus]